MLEKITMRQPAFEGFFLEINPSTTLENHFNILFIFISINLLYLCMDDLGNISIPGVKGVARLCRLVTLYERPLWDTNYSQFTVRSRSRVFFSRVR